MRETPDDPDATMTPSPLRARLTGDQRRALILDSARREFARRGFHGASTACIASAAGCSEPMLYKHFASKQALFAAALEYVTSTIEGNFDGLFSRGNNLLDNLDQYLPGLMQDPAYVEMMQLRKLAVTMIDEPSVRETLEGIQSRHLARMAEAVEIGNRQGAFRPGVDASYIAWMWTGMMLAGCFRESLDPGGFADMLPHIETFIDGLRADID